MLKGTLECKKLGSQAEKEAVEDSSNGFFNSQDACFKTGFSERHENWSHQKPINVQGASIGQVKAPGVLRTLEGSIDLNLDGFANQTNPLCLGTASQEPSQSESSAAAPVVSSGLDACDGPSHSIQTLI